MRISRYDYDEACETLAVHFLAGEPHAAKDTIDLAQAIQDAVEAWFAARPLASNGGGE